MSADDFTLEFRTGKRVVPEHLYHELALLDTHRMTYEEAVAAADRARQDRFLGDVQHQVLLGHFNEQRRGF